MELNGTVDAVYPRGNHGYGIPFCMVHSGYHMEWVNFYTKQVQVPTRYAVKLSDLRGIR